MNIIVKIKEEDTFYAEAFAENEKLLILFEYKDHPFFCNKNLTHFKKEALDIIKNSDAEKKHFVHDGFYNNYIQILNIKRK